MKYIKKFENQKQNTDYNVGDFVILTNNAGYPEQKLDTYNMYKIIAIPTASKNILYIEYYNKNFKTNETWLHINDIERVATKDEVKKFLIEMDAEKYNL